jgi:hypothetical protein
MSKSRSKRNALRHGVYSREPMLPGEKIGDYETLQAELNEEWAPEGASERGLVGRLVALYWRRQRLERYEHLRLQQRLDEIHNKSEVSRHVQNLKNLGPQFGGAESVEAVEKILSRLSPLYVDIITGSVPQETFKNSPGWGAAIDTFLSRINPKDQLEGPAMFIAIVNPDSFEHEIARSERVDEAIDRTIKRLMQVKTAKQIFPKMRNAIAGPRLINAEVSPRPNSQPRENEHNVKLPDTVEVFAKPNPLDPNGSNGWDRA